MEWAAVVSALAGLLLYLLKRYDERKPDRDNEARNDHIQQGRKDIADGNAAAVSERIDRLLTDRPPGQPSSPVTTGRLSAILRVADGRRSVSKDS